MNSHMPGGTILWEYVVTNCGNLPLSNIIVTDDNGTPGNPADDWSPTYVSGDNGDLVLQTNKTWIYRASGTDTASQYANEAMKLHSKQPIPPANSAWREMVLDDTPHCFFQR